MPTPRLYWNDALLLDFDATVVAHAEAGKQSGFVLDRTAFYPEAGGQLADHGRVRWDGGEAAVVDALDVEGSVVHAVSGPRPEVGTRVSVSIDAARRRQHMSQHTGQHLLSRLLLDVAGGATVSSRLGEDVCTIDTPLERLEGAALSEILRRANTVVLEDRPVRIHFPTPAQLAAMPLRRDPKVSEDVRVIEIDGLDFSPCGGTHCTSTGQVGVVQVDGVERHKGGLRITFRTGLRALDTLFARDAALRSLGQELTCGWDEVAPAVLKMRGELQGLRKESERLQARVAVAVADGLVAGASGWVVSAVDGGPSLLRAVAERLSSRVGVASFLWCVDGDGAAVVVVRGEGSKVDAGAVLKAAATLFGGRGGGRPNRAEGRLAAAPEHAKLLELLEFSTPRG